MAGGFNFSEFEAYVAKFEKMQFAFEGWFASFMMEQGALFIRNVKQRTPVDTGDLRNHWQLESMTRKGDVYEVWFINPMEYATHVEYGHAKPYKSGIASEGGPDWVEGYFMMTVSIQDIERNMPARFDKKFKEYLKSVGVI